MNAPDRFASTSIKPVGGPPVVFLHCAIFVSAQQVIGAETLRLVSFSGKESISEPFEFELELHGNTLTSWHTPLSFSDLIGRPVTVGIQTAALDAQGDQPSREDADAWFQAAIDGPSMVPRLSLFNGIVAAFAIDRPGVYRLSMRPALWKTTLTNAYRVHAQCNIRDAIAGLLKRHRVEGSVAALVGSDNPAATRVQDWLQAGETDDEFLRRLMSRAHIYYYFRHSARSHQVIFANRPAYPEALPPGAKLRYCDTEFDEGAMAQPDTLTRFSYKQSMVSGSVNSLITREEAAWEADPVAGFHNYRAASRSQAAPLPFMQYQIVQYGGSVAEVDHLTHATQHALDASGREFAGASLCPHLRCGHRFTVTAHPRADQLPRAVRPELEGCSFVLTQITHEASLDGTYRNEFSATDADGLVAAFSLRDTQQGSLLGEVVATPDAPAPTDWRYGDKDSCDPELSRLSDSACTQPTLNARGVMVLLSTATEGEPPVWIKLAAHMQTVPEIGATVMVSRAQDQTELPEVQSIIQSNVNQVVMPSGWTANTTVGSSYSTSYGDGKSIRFGLRSSADLDGAIAKVEGPYRSGLYRESSYAQGASYSFATAEQGSAGLLSRSDSFGSSYSTHHGAVSSSSTVFGSTESTSVVTGVARSVSNHATVISESTSQDTTSTSLVTGSNNSVSMVGSSTDVSLAGSSTNISLKGLSTTIEITGAGISAQIAGATMNLKITLLEIIL